MAIFWSAPASSAETNFVVKNYVVKGGAALSSNTVNAILSKYTGTNLGLTELAHAASDLQSAYGAAGYTNLSVAIARDRFTNGVVTMNLFRGLVPQILISGKRYTNSNQGLAVTLPSTAVVKTPTPGKTNAPPGFLVRAYEITGDTLLSTNTLMNIFAKRTGTNVTVPDILKAASDLQTEYRSRGYPTVQVSLPQQQLTNGIVKIRVFEGRLAGISVEKNRYFSSNNVMRALPSLQCGIIISSPIFQAELDRANMNQDRQIYPQLEEGELPNTTNLRLEVRDRLPLHGKVDFNNQSSPGTPELRLNSSAVYNNLWQLEHSIGVQYGFSPEKYKGGDQWHFYDLPLVANYSAFYRMPLASAETLSQAVARGPGSFGYNEATRRFQLPAQTGAPELNFYASRSTIDTGLETLSEKIIQSIPGVLSIREQDVQQDLTINGDLGTRLSLPVRSTANFQSGFSGGLDYKTYELTSFKTNNFIFSIITVNPDGSTNPPVTSIVSSPVPTTHHLLDYVPLSLGYNAALHDPIGTTTFSVGLSGNVWYSGSLNQLQATTGSSQSTGYWFILNPSLSRDIIVYTNWTLSLHANGQWTTQPLISTEQFGIGGVNSVRGYREGEIFGDTGWRIGVDQKTPPHVIGLAYGKNPLIVRGSIYMDYAEAYLLDPEGRKGRVPLWGAGFGGVFSVGPHFEARFLFSWPFLSTTTTEAYQPRFDFSLSAQF